MEWCMLWIWGIRYTVDLHYIYNIYTWLSTCICICCHISSKFAWRACVATFAHRMPHCQVMSGLGWCGDRIVLYLHGSACCPRNETCHWYFACGCCECSGSNTKLAEMDLSERGICYSLHCVVCWSEIRPVLDFLVNPSPPRTAAKVPTLRAPVGSAKRAAEPATVTSLRPSTSSKRHRSGHKIL